MHGLQEKQVSDDNVSKESQDCESHGLLEIQDSFENEIRETQDGESQDKLPSEFAVKREGMYSEPY